MDNEAGFGTDNMDSSELNDFESQLRGFLPSAEHRLNTEQTFYQAGWNAAMVADNSRPAPRQPARRIRPAGWYLSGIVSGVIVAAVCVGVWNSLMMEQREVLTHGQTVLNDASNSDGDAVVSSDRVESSSDGSARTAVAGENRSYVASIFPWAWSPPTTRQPFIASADGPLSVAARHQWGDLLEEPATRTDMRQTSRDSMSTQTEASDDALRPASVRKWFARDVL